MNDWLRTVAVVIQGHEWQFQSWPFADFRNLFSVVRWVKFKQYDCGVVGTSVCLNSDKQSAAAWLKYFKILKFVLPAFRGVYFAFEGETQLPSLVEKYDVDVLRFKRSSRHADLLAWVSNWKRKKSFRFTSVFSLFSLFLQNQFVDILIRQLKEPRDFSKFDRSKIKSLSRRWAIQICFVCGMCPTAVCVGVSFLLFETPYILQLILIVFIFF